MRRLKAVGILLLLVSTLVSLDSIPAVAQVSGDFIYVKSKEPVGPGGPGIADRLCPPGSRTTGVGASMSDANGTNAWLTGIAPLDTFADGDLDGDDGGSTEGWNASSTARSLTVFTICSKAADAVDQTYKRADSMLGNTTSAAQAYVTCLGAGQEILGGGGGTTANAHDRLALASPNATSFSYGIRGNNPSARTMSGFAICLPAANRDVTIRTKTVSVRPLEVASGRVFCPVGTRVTGGGVGNGDLRQVISSRPIDGSDADSVTDDGWAMKVRNPDTDQRRDSIVSAVCAGPLLI